MKKTTLMMMMILALGACGNAFRNPPEVPAVTIELEGKSLCDKTEGAWNAMAVSCLCPRNKVFRSETGCIPLTPSPVFSRCAYTLLESADPQIEACFKNLYKEAQVHVEWSQFSETEKKRFIRSLSSDLAFPLRGYTLPKRSDSYYFMVSPQTDSDLEFQIRFALSGGGYSDYFPKISIPADNQHLDSKRCLENLGKDLTIEVAEDLCGRADRLYKKVFFEKNQVLENMGWISYGRNCSPSCAQIFEKDSDSFLIRLPNNVPAFRKIEIKKTNTSLLILVGPMGGVQGILLSLDKISTKDYLATTENSFFSGNWKLLAKNDVNRGDIKSVMSSLLPPEVERFDFENLDLDLSGEIRTALIDNGFDVTLSGIGTRIDRNYRWDEPLGNRDVDAFFNLFDKISLVGPYRSDLAHRMDLVSGGRIDGGETHAGSVASVLVKNLPDAKVDFLQASELKGETLERLVKYLKDKGTRVVNISQSYEVPNCEALFSPLLNGLTGVLFVAAAGNSGTENPESCPAKLWKKFPNLISVAGTDENGGISKSSSYGEDVAAVATSFTTHCQRQGGSRRCSGTSFSAPLISNMALRLLLTQPKTTAAEAKKKLMSSCTAEDLDVGCRGRLDWEDWAKNYKGDNL